MDNDNNNNGDDKVVDFVKRFNKRPPQQTILNQGQGQMVHPPVEQTARPHWYLIRMEDPGEETGITEVEVEGYLLCTGVWTAVMSEDQNVIFSCPSVRVVWCQDIEALQGQVEIEHE